MRSEAPEGVFVLPDLPEVDPQCIQIEYLAQLAFLYHLPQPFDSRMVDQEVAGQYRHAALSPLPRYYFGIPHVQRERLLDQDRLPRLDDLSGDRGMRGGRRRHDDGIHAPEQRRHVCRHQRPGILTRYPLANLGIGVAHRREFAFRQSCDRPDVVATPGPGAEYADLEALHR